MEWHESFHGCNKRSSLEVGNNSEMVCTPVNKDSWLENGPGLKMKMQFQPENMEIPMGFSLPEGMCARV